MLDTFTFEQNKNILREENAAPVNVRHMVASDVKKPSALLLEGADTIQPTDDEPSLKRLEDLSTSVETFPKTPLEQYLSDIRKVNLLTPEGEVSLAQRIEAGKLAAQRLEQVPTPQAGDKAMLEAFIKDGKEAEEHLIEANLRLVVSVAKRLRPLAGNLGLLDLIQEGNRGLVHAAQKFDYHRGYRFSTSAVWWIRQAMLRAIENTSRTIRLPVHLSNLLRQLSKTFIAFQQQLGRNPTSTEMAEKLGPAWDAQRVETFFLRLRQPISLELPLSEAEETVLGDTLSDDSVVSPGEYADKSALAEALHTALAQLPKREALILEKHYGLLDGESHTLQDIGDDFGVTRERIRQLEQRALNKLRHTKYVQEQLRDFS